MAKIQTEVANRIKNEVSLATFGYDLKGEQAIIWLDGPNANVNGDDSMLLAISRGKLVHEYYKTWKGEPSERIPKGMQDQVNHVIQILKEEGCL